MYKYCVQGEFKVRENFSNQKACRSDIECNLGFCNSKEICEKNKEFCNRDG